MKKVLTVLAVLVLVCASVFAADMSVRAHVEPLVFDASTGVEKIQPMLGKNNYAFDFDAEFDYYVTENVRVGAKFDSLFSGTNATLAGFAKAGYVYPIDSQWSVAADLGLGAYGQVALASNKTASELAFTGNAELTGAYKFNENFALDFGAKITVCFPEANLTEAYFGPIVGVEYKF